MPILLILLLALPLVELLFSLWLGNILGFWAVLWLILATAAGFLMLRHRQLGILASFGLALRQGRSLYALLWPIRYLVAGVLLIFPGFLSDFLALILMLPLKISTKQAPPHFYQNPNIDPNHHPDQDPNIIEGEFTEIPQKRLPPKN